MNTGDERRVAVIIEDDPDIRHLLETVLAQAGFQTVATGNGLDGIQAVRAYEPIVVTLDVSMPGMDGLEVAKRIRTFSNTYIVMLTALDEEIDILQGLESGADDYVTKPFRPRELRARIEAMLRRPRGPAAEPTPPPAPVAAPTYPTAPVQPVAPPVAPAPPTHVPAEQPVYAPPAAEQPVYAQEAPAPRYDEAPPRERTPVAPHPRKQRPADDAPTAAIEEGWLEYKGLRVNPEMRIVEVAGEEIDLTRSEFDLVESLMQSGRRVRSKADLALMLRGESYVTSYFVNEADKRAVEVHMANLRRKLGDSSSTPRWIETVRGVGYRLAAPTDGM